MKKTVMKIRITSIVLFFKAKSEELEERERLKRKWKIDTKYFFKMEKYMSLRTQVVKFDLAH